MFGLTLKTPAILVERGSDHFAPARPEPLTGHRPALHRLRIGRRNLLAIWHQNDYRAGVDQIRIFGRQLVVANSPDSVKHVMVARHDNYERKSPQMRRALEWLLGDGLFISDGATWAKRRPLVADIVHKQRVPSFGLTMEQVTAEFVHRWMGRPAGEPFDALAEMAELTAEIIARAVFGNELGAEAARDVIAGFSRYQSLIDSTNFGYFLGADEGWPILRGPRLRGAVRKVHAVIDGVVEKHLAGGGEEGSMIALLVRRQKKNPELGLDVQALRNEAATIFMAGHETTAATLTWAWYLVAGAPWVEEAVLAEIAEVCGDRPPTVADVARLDWCRAVVEETLRLYPPVPILARQARGADDLLGTPIEPAALVLVVPWLIQRSPDLWERPERFMPERFLGERRPVPYSYLPFAVGPRICAGLAFGLTEAILCFATLIQRFRIRPVAPSAVEPVCRLTLRPAGGLAVTAEIRR